MKEFDATLGPEFLYDMQEWRARYEMLALAGRCDYQTAKGPVRAAAVEVEREGRPEIFESSPTLSTDAFEFALGEPSRGDVTKIGGTPWREVGSPWPVTSQGRPMHFLFQVRLAEVRDLIGETPGDLCFFFVDGPKFEEYYVAWGPLHVTTPTTEQEMPPSEWKHVRCYGVRRRATHYPSWKGRAAYASAAMQVGNPFPGFGPEDARWIIALPPVEAMPSIPFPWVNVPEPWTDAMCEDPANRLSSWEFRSLVVYFSEDGLLDVGFH